LRVGVIKNWDSRWYASDENFGDILVSDYNLRKHLKNKLLASGVSKIEIERDAANEMVKVFIHCAKPGMIIGKGGAEIENIRKDVEKLTGKKAAVNVVEVKHIDTDAQLVAESICSQLERRIGFRRAMKQAIGRTMKFAKGIKIACSGRLGGAEIARTEHYHEGTIPLQTIRADIDYGFWEANTTYGKIGVKVWIYKGEVLSEVSKTVEEKNDRPKRRFNKDNKGDGRRRAPRAPKNTEGGAH
jgi:small subunit ribosomal protein S3